MLHIEASDRNLTTYILLPLLCLTPPAEGFPWDDLREIQSLKVNVSVNVCVANVCYVQCIGSVCRLCRMLCLFPVSAHTPFLFAFCVFALLSFCINCSIIL